MIFKFGIRVLICVVLVGCSSALSPLEEVSKKYKQNRDYNSLEVIYKQLTKGTQRSKIERLLGDPDYSPTDGLYYYSSNKHVYSQLQGSDVVQGLIVDYRDKKGSVTPMLQQFVFGPIGE